MYDLSPKDNVDYNDQDNDQPIVNTGVTGTVIFGNPTEAISAIWQLVFSLKAFLIVSLKEFQKKLHITVNSKRLCTETGRHRRAGTLVHTCMCFLNNVIIFWPSFSFSDHLSKREISHVSLLFSIMIVFFTIIAKDGAVFFIFKAKTYPLMEKTHLASERTLSMIKRPESTHLSQSQCSWTKHMPDISHLFYINTFSDLKILHSKVRKFVTKQGKLCA